MHVTKGLSCATGSIRSRTSTIFLARQCSPPSVLERDFSKLIDLGGNIYFLVKLSNTDGWSAQRAVSSMTGMTPDEYAAMMRAGGRSPVGQKSKREQGEGSN